jgi:hypothetical protein
MNSNAFFDDENTSDAALIQAYSDEYARNDDGWKSIENKAQGTIAVAGIFAGFALSYLSDMPSELTSPMRFLFVAVVVLLFASIVAALFALHVRAYKTAPSGTYYDELVRKYKQASSDGDGPYTIKLNLQKNVLDAWRKAVADSQSANEEKAKRVTIAQVLLLAAIALTMGFSTWVALTVRSHPSSGEVRIYEMH